MRNYCYTLFPCFCFGVFDHQGCSIFKFSFSFVVQFCFFVLYVFPLWGVYYCFGIYVSVFSGT